jgi:hypothetical protein
VIPYRFAPFGSGGIVDDGGLLFLVGHRCRIHLKSVYNPRRFRRTAKKAYSIQATETPITTKVF